VVDPAKLKKIQEKKDLAKRIANGHAAGKHVLTKKGFTDSDGKVIDSLEKLEAHVFAVMSLPVAKEINKTGGKDKKGRAYYCSKSNTVVIVNSTTAKDPGTVFKPINKKAYVDNNVS
jgi:hypothetical protein